VGRDQEQAPEDEDDEEDERGDLFAGAAVHHSPGRVAELVHDDPAFRGRVLRFLDVVDVGGEGLRGRVGELVGPVGGGRLGEDGDDRQVGVVLEPQSVERPLADDLRAALLRRRFLFEDRQILFVRALALDRVRGQPRFAGDQGDRQRAGEEAGEDGEDETTLSKSAGTIS